MAKPLLSGRLRRFSCTIWVLNCCLRCSPSRWWSPCRVSCAELVFLYQLGAAVKFFFFLPLIVFRSKSFPSEQVLDFCASSPSQHSLFDNCCNFPFRFWIICSSYNWRRRWSRSFERVFLPWSRIQIDY